MEIAWAITGRVGFYYGTYHLRNEAIARHVYAIDKVCYDSGRRTPGLGSALDANQIRAWNACRRRGDRAVKVRIEEIRRD